MSEATYQQTKEKMDEEDPMTAYCGFAISFGGKWYGGFARSGAGTEKSQENQKKAVMRKASTIKKIGEAVVLGCRSYEQNLPTGRLVYLDPPYENRTKAHNFASKFDHAAFWKWATEISRDNNVLATEFKIPSGWKSVYDFGDTVVRHHASLGSDDTKEHILRCRK